jgi:hypothetical protein
VDDAVDLVIVEIVELHEELDLVASSDISTVLPCLAPLLLQLPLPKSLRDLLKGGRILIGRAMDGRFRPFAVDDMGCSRGDGSGLRW